MTWKDIKHDIYSIDNRCKVQSSELYYGMGSTICSTLIFSSTSTLPFTVYKMYLCISNLCCWRKLHLLLHDVKGEVTCLFFKDIRYLHNMIISCIPVNYHGWWTTSKYKCIIIDSFLMNLYPCEKLIYRKCRVINFELFACIMFPESLPKLVHNAS